MTSGSVPRDARRPEIDWLKGFAILCVLLIHAKPMEGSAIQIFLIDRAVPMFVVLFGMTSERWWQTRTSMPLGDTLAEWYRTRLQRLMVPVWGTLLVWWMFTWLFRPMVPIEPKRILLTAFGYLPWIGTGWFVTLILELVVLFPLVHLVLRFTGDVLGVLIAVAMLAASYAGMFHAVELMRLLLRDTALPHNPFFYFWIFPPAWIYGVTLGAVLMRRGTTLRPHQAAACIAAAWLLLESVRIAQVSLLWQRAAVALVDPFLTAGMLGVVPAVAWWSPAAWFLAWCGAWSWGLYLGQLLVHNACFAFGLNLSQLSPRQRWGYFACLFVGAVGLASIGQAIRIAAARVSRARTLTRHK